MMILQGGPWCLAFVRSIVSITTFDDHDDGDERMKGLAKRCLHPR